LAKINKIYIERMVQKMMTITEKIDKVLEKLEELCKSNEEKAWLESVCEEAAKKPLDEKVAYLEGRLQALRDTKNEELDEAEPQKETPVRLHTNWVMVVLAVFVVVIVFLVLGMFNGKHKANDVKAADSKTVSSLVLPKEEFQIVDYKVDNDTIVYDKDIANTQQKVFANGSKADSLSADADIAVNEMIQYMSHNATALKEKAMTFGIIDASADTKDWLEKKDGKVYYNQEGRDILYQTKAFISRSQVSSKKMEEGSNYYATGVDNKGNVVVSESAQDLSGQQYVEISSPKGSTEKYTYRVLVYCGNTVMKSNDIPGVKTGKVEIPKPNKPEKPGEPEKPGKPDKPGKPSEPGKPDKPGESKVEKKDPSKDPANQGKAPVGGGKNDGSSNGSETSQASLPEQYSAPAAPSASAPASSTAPSQDAPSQWSGAGTVTDSNGTTTVADNGAVTTPDNHHYDGLVGQSAPTVESGANGVTTPSSSANFAGNGSMSEPAIDD
jgi:hypothetical protein